MMDLPQLLLAVLSGLAFVGGYLLGARDQRRYTRRHAPAQPTAEQ